MSQSTSPLVSVIIATYNYAHFIEETLRCVQSQTYTSWECLVVDDGSTDDTRGVVGRLAGEDSRIKYLHQANAGQAAARNNALRQSAGAYVQFLDADDVLEQCKLELHVSFLEEQRDVDIVYGSARYFTTEKPQERLYSMDGLNRHWMPETSGAGADVVRELVCRNILTINSALVRREVILDVGAFDEALPPLEDWEFFIRCAVAGKRFQFVDLPQTHALVRSHPASTSKNHARMRRAERLVRTKVAATLSDSQTAMLNQDLLAYLEGTEAVEEVIGGATLKGARRLLRASAESRRWRWKAKWLLFALLSPVTPRRQFEQITSFAPARLIGSLRGGGRAA